MRQSFSEFYLPTGKEIDELWSNADIVVDTNVLLNLYRYSAATRDELLSVLNGFKNQLWLPKHVAAEYHRRRADVILDQLRIYRAAREAFAAVRPRLSEDLREFLSRGQHPTVDLKSFLDRIGHTAGTIVGELEEAEHAHPDLLQNDAVRDQLDKLFDGRVGQGFAVDALPELLKRGRDRYDKQIPPGYKDSKKPGDEQFGDYIIWEEIIAHACESKRPIVFVTDDVKDDWWWRVKGRTLGARPELLREIRDRADVDLHLYSADRFMQFGLQYLDRKPADSAIEEVRELRLGADESKTSASGTSFAASELSKRIVEVLRRFNERSRDVGGGVDLKSFQHPILDDSLGKPQSGDRVRVFIQRRDVASNGSEYDIVLGRGDTLDGLEASIRALNVGEEGTFEIEVPSSMAEGPKPGVGQFSVKLLASIKSPPSVS